MAMLAALVLMQSAVFAADEKPTRVVPFKTVGDVTLNLHVFEPAGHKPTDKRPAIVFFFGGGWVSGSPSQFYPQAQRLADLGLVAMCAEYRINSKHNTTAIECVKDGKSAIRFVRSHATGLGVDPQRIAAGGGSAGGHVAAATATITAFNEDGENTSVSAVPDALVLFNAVYDNGPVGGWGFGRVREYWQKISPAHNIHAGMPPTIAFLGDSDPLIPVATAKRFQKAMTDAGVRSELKIYEGAAHGFFNNTKHDGRFYRETLAAAEQFLQSLGWLD
jgi:acetyl esterase/lipase